MSLPIGLMSSTGNAAVVSRGNGQAAPTVSGFAGLLDGVLAAAREAQGKGATGSAATSVGLLLANEGQLPKIVGELVDLLKGMSTLVASDKAVGLADTPQDSQMADLLKKVEAVFAQLRDTPVSGEVAPTEQETASTPAPTTGTAEAPPVPTQPTALPAGTTSLESTDPATSGLPDAPVDATPAVIGNEVTVIEPAHVTPSAETGAAAPIVPQDKAEETNSESANGETVETAATEPKAPDANPALIVTPQIQATVTRLAASLGAAADALEGQFPELGAALGRLAAALTPGTPDQRTVPLNQGNAGTSGDTPDLPPVRSAQPVTAPQADGTTKPDTSSANRVADAPTRGSAPVLPPEIARDIQRGLAELQALLFGKSRTGEGAQQARASRPETPPAAPLPLTPNLSERQATRPQATPAANVSASPTPTTPPAVTNAPTPVQQNPGQPTAPAPAADLPVEVAPVQTSVSRPETAAQVTSGRPAAEAPVQAQPTPDAPRPAPAPAAAPQPVNNESRGAGLPKPGADNLPGLDGLSRGDGSQGQQVTIKLEQGAAARLEFATSLRAPVQQINVPGIAVAMARQFSAGQTRFQIRLDPPEMGRIDVRMDLDGNAVRAHLTVDRPETLEMLQRDVRGLERALQQAGIQSDRTNLEFSLRQNPFGTRQDGGQGQHNPDFNHQGQADSGSDHDQPTAEPSVAANASYRPAASPGGVNVWV